MKLSFIIPNRGGNNFEIIKKNLDTFYKDNYELIIVNQQDNNLFVRGQLFNIGVKYAKYNNLILTDNDIVHFHNIDFDLIYEKFKKPFSCWKHIQQCTYKNNKFIFGDLQKNRLGNGGCNFITKDDYLKINGMSNLYCGWGAEDDEYKLRVVKIFSDWIKIPNTIGHLTHPNRVNYNKKNTELNYQMLKDFDNRNFMLDGINETKYDLIKIEENNNVKNIYVKNITVNQDFIYFNLFKKHFIV